jgi:hypothetical protein
MAIVHWGDAHLAGRKGRPLIHTHDLCGKDFDPVMVCSQCAEPVLARQVHVRPGPGAAQPARLPAGTPAPVRTAARRDESPRGFDAGCAASASRQRARRQRLPLDLSRRRRRRSTA